MEKTAGDDVDQKKKGILRGDCTGCGATTDDLTACLCLTKWKDRSGGVALCDQCREKHGTKCALCAALICSPEDPLDGCRGGELSHLCGYDDDFPDADCCGAAICGTCLQGSGWKPCFCGKVKFCPPCSVRGNSGAVFQCCATCGTLYCNDEKGDCGRDCGDCFKQLCCRCLGVNDPRSLDYCADCKPNHESDRKRRRSERGSSAEEEDSEFSRCDGDGDY